MVGHVCLFTKSFICLNSFGLKVKPQILLLSSVLLFSVLTLAIPSHDVYGERPDIDLAILNVFYDTGSKDLTIVFNEGIDPDSFEPSLFFFPSGFVNGDIQRALNLQSSSHDISGNTITVSPTSAISDRIDTAISDPHISIPVLRSNGPTNITPNIPHAVCATAERGGECLEIIGFAGIPLTILQPGVVPPPIIDSDIDLDRIDRILTVIGNGLTGHSIELFDRGTSVGDTPVDSNGFWEISVPIGTSPNFVTHTFTATATNSGVTSARSNQASIGVDGLQLSATSVLYNHIVDDDGEDLSGELIVTFNDDIVPDSVNLSNFQIIDFLGTTIPFELRLIGTNETPPFASTFVVDGNTITITLVDRTLWNRINVSFTGDDNSNNEPYDPPVLRLHAGAVGSTLSTTNLEGDLTITIPPEPPMDPEEPASGGSSNDWKKKPTFGKSWEVSSAQLVENGFTFNDYTLDITDNFHTEFVLTESIIGDTNHVDIKVYTDKILRDVTLSLGVPEIGKASEAETDIIIQLDRDYTIPDDYTITGIVHEQKESLVNEEDTDSSISKVKCASDSLNELCYIIGIDFSISAPLKSNVLAISATDFDRRSTVTYINDGVEFTGESLLEPVTHELFSKRSSQDASITLELTQIDRRYSTYADQFGNLWEHNDSMTWSKITPDEFERHQDKSTTSMTRMHSAWNDIMEHEVARATGVFDSSAIQSTPEDPLTIDYVIGERIDNETKQYIKLSEMQALEILSSDAQYYVHDKSQ